MHTKNAKSSAPIVNILYKLQKTPDFYNMMFIIMLIIFLFDFFLLLWVKK